VTKEKIGTVSERLHRLGLGKDGGDEVDKQESTRRDVLLSALGQVEGKLRKVSDRVEVVGYTENDGDAQIVCELMDDIRDAVIDYQTAQQQAVYDQNLKLIDRG